MTPAVQTWIAIAVALAAVAYLASHWVRRARRLFSKSTTGTGCGGCGSCGTTSEAAQQAKTSVPAELVRFDKRSE
jgi:hypothetical protein